MEKPRTYIIDGSEVTIVGTRREPFLGSSINATLYEVMVDGERYRFPYETEGMCYHDWKEDGGKRYGDNLYIIQGCDDAGEFVSDDVVEKIKKAFREDEKHVEIYYKV